MLSLVLVAAALSGAGAARPPDVAVLRCCARGARLAPPALEAGLLPRAAAACEPADHDDWRPRVFAPGVGKFLAPGRLPPNWHVTYDQRPDCDQLRVLHEHAAPYSLLANNASLWPSGTTRTVPPNRYCADTGGALVCAEEVTAPRLRKCCGENRTVLESRCELDPEGAGAATRQLRALGGHPLARGWPACAAGSHYADAGVLAGAALAADGALVLAGGARLAAGAWCADGAPARVWRCAGRAAAPALRHVLYGCALAVGALFLAATLAAGFALPAQHHALHWRCQTHYVAALMLGDVLLAVTQLAAPSLPPLLCRALAVCMHFLFLSAFFWLNTMCFNIWWTFRDFRPTRVERGQEAWRLRVYALYAWGGPGALAAAAAALDAAPGPLPRGLLRPRFAEAHCWFAGDTEMLVYFFGPVGVLLLINLALFISTTRQLTCGLWRRDEVKSTSERAALGRVCAKLVVVMGVTWGADVVSWAAGGPEALWYVSDVLNALQGVLIFCVAGARQHAAAALRRACSRLYPPAAPPLTSSTHLPSCGDSLTHSTPAPSAPAPAAPPALQPPPPPRMETVC